MMFKKNKTKLEQDHQKYLGVVQMPYIIFLQLRSVK